MAWTLVKNEPGAGAAAPLGSDWTEQAGVANWAKDGSGSIVPGESYETAVRYTTELASADMAVEAQISAAAAGDMNHFLIIRSDAAINDVAAFDSVRIFGSEVYYNGAYQDPLSYGNLPSFVTDPVIRVEAQGSTYTFIFDGTTVGTLTARLDGTGGKYAGFKGQGSSEWLDLNIYVWEEESSEVDLTGSESVVTVVNDSGSITQTHVLTAAESVTSVVNDAGAVTQTHVLTGTGSTVAVVNDAGTVTQTHVLTAAESVVVVVNDEGTITAGVSLTGNTSVVTVVNDSGAVTQTHVLEATGSTVAVVNDSGEVTAGSNLVGVPSVVSVVNDQGAVTQTHVLTAGESVVLVVNGFGSIVAEGDSLIQISDATLSARFSVAGVVASFDAALVSPSLSASLRASSEASLSTRWAAGPLTK